MSLYVDIRKTLGNFRLRARFETENEVFAILGASGCGKSMTLKCIAGIERPDEGVIRLDDRTLFDSERHINLPARKRKIGYLFQDYALFPNMTVMDNILCGARDRATARRYLERFCPEGKEDLYPGQLSGGQKQRVALARMLAAEPEYLLLDEPFSALDNYLKAGMERELMDVMDDYGRRAILVSHDRNEVYRLTDRIAVMEQGRVEDVLPKHELFESPRSLAAALLTGCKNMTGLEYRPDGIYASDWGIYLKTGEPGVSGDGSGQRGADGGSGQRTPYRYAAVRAHYFEPTERACPDEMCIECRILREVEDTFSMVVLFRNQNMDSSSKDSILTAEFGKEEWERIRSRTISAGRPLWMRIPADRIMWMER
ncbi:MAG: ATP-binding cassette domain-containing protein [Clostridium sp.]|nr:ATP-binding cassette domain-containing protein [Acetatifactor muris]MCM1527341.1 ATP-binding cassette domain-containing protein [Bacteroides sp.]MCM1563620.1 ATP-binding cassette domain-containing protein [Clostridium sp.]